MGKVALVGLGRFSYPEIYKSLRDNALVSLAVLSEPLCKKQDRISPTGKVIRHKILPIGKLMSFAARMLPDNACGRYIKSEVFRVGTLFFGFYAKFWLQRSESAINLAIIGSGSALETIRSDFSGKVCLYVGSCNETFAQSVVEKFREFGTQWSDGNQSRDWMRRRMEVEVSLCDYVVVCSKLAKETFVTQGFAPEKFFVLNPPSDVEYFSSASRLRRDMSFFNVVHFSNLKALKGIDLLIKSLQGLNHIPNLKLWLIGPYKTSEIVRRLKPDRFDFKIIFCGRMSHPEIRDFLADMHVAVFPSFIDGWGKVVSQAMATGLPTIASDYSGASELIIDGENGFIATTGSVCVLQKKIDWVYSNYECALQLGFQGKKDVLAALSMSEYKKRWREAINEMRL